MTSVARRAHLWHSLFSLLGGVLLCWAVPFLLLLADPLRTQVMLTLLVSMLTGGIIAGIVIRFRIRKHSFLLHALSVETFAAGEASIAPAALANFLAEPPKIVRAWLYPQYLALALFATPLRPSPLDWTTSLAVGLLAVLILSTASLPLLVLIRNDFSRVVERAPANCAQELVVEAEKNGKTRYQLNRRIVAAVAMPVVFVALGSALIVNAHLRRDDERFRAETARMLALGALELHRGTVQTIEPAVHEATKLGFPAQVASQGARYGVILERGGITELTVPLSIGSARVRYDSSVVPVVGMAPLFGCLVGDYFGELVGSLARKLVDDGFAARSAARTCVGLQRGGRSQRGVDWPPTTLPDGQRFARRDRAFGRSLFGVRASTRRRYSRAGRGYAHAWFVLCDRQSRPQRAAQLNIGFHAARECRAADNWATRELERDPQSRARTAGSDRNNLGCSPGRRRPALLGARRDPVHRSV